jgi:hypothetical protein
MTEAVSKVTFVATLQGAQRLLNTESGNPRWRVFTPSGALLTEPDALCEVTEHFGKLVRFTVNGKGRIIGIERVEHREHE